MTSGTSIAPDQIVAALGRSERYAEGSELFEIFSPFIGQLAEIVGEDRLNETITIGGLCEITGKFVRALCANTEFMSRLDGMDAMMVAMAYGQLAVQLDAIAEDPGATLSQLGVTEAEAMEMDELGLSETAKELYRNGELTYAQLLLTSPDTFIPRP